MIAVVCTGRDTHPRTFIAEVDPAERMSPRRGNRRLSSEESRQLSSDTAGSGHEPTGHQTFHFRCPACPGRSGHWEMGPETWGRLVNGLIVADATSIDLSRLPF